MKNKEISLRKWLQRYWAGMSLFLAFVYFIAQSYMFVTLTNRAEENIQKSISIASKGMEDSLEIVDCFIYEALSGETVQSTSRLYNSLKYETDPIALSSAKNIVASSLRSIVIWSDMIDFILLYTDRTDQPFWFEAGNTDNYKSRKVVKQYIAEIIETNEIENLDQYLICSKNGNNYMLRLIKIEGSYLVVGVSEKELLSTLKCSAYDKDSIPFAARESGKVIFPGDLAADTLSSRQEGKYVRIDGKDYLQTGYISDRTGYYFGMLTSKDSIEADMWIFRLVFIFIFLVLMLLVPSSFVMIYRYVEKPIETLSASMNQIAEGELDILVEEQPRITELSQFVKTFNHMIGRIKKLKIEKYEVKLEAQKATMQYLQLQIKPHFYANVLNIIYSLAERREFETIQKVSNAIVNYSRYMFRDASELVELKREIEHVRYYMEIQNIRYMKRIACEIDVKEEIESALIPPFMIQSFVENSVKYGLSTKKSCRITIEAKTDEKKEFLYITIRDNGQGYDEELLHLDWEEKSEDGHIGLINVYKRLKLIYNDKARIQLQNDCGAVATIRIPYIGVDNMDFEDDE